MSHIVFFFTRSPTENTVVNDAFDAVITAAIFDKKILLIFEEVSWSSFLTQKNHKEMITATMKKLKTIASLTEIKVFIKSQLSSNETSHELKAKKALTQFFDEIPCKIKLIDNKEFQKILNESDKILSF